MQTSRKGALEGLRGRLEAGLVNGTFLKPESSAKGPDPSILRGGSNYFLAFPGFGACPGLPSWRPTDPVEQPLSGRRYRSL